MNVYLTSTVKLSLVKFHNGIMQTPRSPFSMNMLGHTIVG